MSRHRGNQTCERDIILANVKYLWDISQNRAGQSGLLGSRAVSLDVPLWCMTKVTGVHAQGRIGRNRMCISISESLSSPLRRSTDTMILQIGCLVNGVMRCVWISGSTHGSAESSRLNKTPDRGELRNRSRIQMRTRRIISDCCRRIPFWVTHGLTTPNFSISHANRLIDGVLTFSRRPC